MRDQSGKCANCGERIYRLANGKWEHSYTLSQRCIGGGKVMHAFGVAV